MARRLAKLGPTISHHVYQFVHDTAKVTETLLSKRWIAFQNVRSISPTLQFKGLDFPTDSHISLDNSSKYLTDVLRSASLGLSLSQMPFNPSHEFRLYDIHDFTQFANGQLAAAITKDPYVAILDFELSVEKNLESWTAASTNNDNSSDVMASCIEQYFSSAKDLYKANIEDYSVMILTIMDLWVALDRLAIKECPLLKQYSPEIPSEFLHGLLLHRSSSLKRALHIEQYLCQRHKDALDVPSIFSNNFEDSCFALRYFCTSEKLQRLHVTNMDARRNQGLHSTPANLDYKRKLDLLTATDMKHESWMNDFLHRVPKATRQKCRLQDHDKAQKIRVLESWFSPKVKTEVVVFELFPPRAFSVWRDITYLILCDIGLHSDPDSCIPSQVLLDPLYELYDLEAQPQQFRRVTLCPYFVLFLGSIKTAASPEEELSNSPDGISVSIGLFDHIRRSRIKKSFSESSPTKLCTPPIPNSSPYSRLHHFMSGTQHTPNDIIASQAECPDKINLHEFIAFSGLRSSPRLQWLNIARELASPSLSFRCEELHTLITQAAWQLGPLSNDVREWHVDLNIPSFGRALLHEMGCLLEKIKSNWLEEVTVRTIGGSDYPDPHILFSSVASSYL